MKVTFITGNEHKARILAQYLGYPVEHQKVDLDEIQSLELHEIVEHKVKQAYGLVKSPVLVEDVGLKLDSLNRLPGPFIKWFLEELGTEGICRLADKLDSRKATAMITFAYYDGVEIKFFDGEIRGSIAPEPRGKDFGWNPVFIPDGADETYAEMDDKGRLDLGLRTSTVFPLIKDFLTSLDNK
jgi:non-canonical purine NTP pyrophosphatase (RdgB/HAM1 family)